MGQFRKEATSPEEAQARIWRAASYMQKAVDFLNSLKPEAKPVRDIPLEFRGRDRRAGRQCRLEILGFGENLNDVRAELFSIILIRREQHGVGHGRSQLAGKPPPTNRRLPT